VTARGADTRDAKAADESGRRAAAKLLTHATNIAKLPYPLQGGAKA
jgi:hypothetical protein